MIIIPMLIAVIEMATSEFNGGGFSCGSRGDQKEGGRHFKNVYNCIFLK